MRTLRDASGRRLRVQRGRRLVLAAMLALGGTQLAPGAPYVPGSDGEILAHVPPGAAHASVPQRLRADARLDVALPLAQFYISQARASGDMRFLGYAEATLAHWITREPPDPQALVLQATILQSRHAFSAALAVLDQALQLRPGDAQAWLTRATVLRVLGRYAEAASACERVAASGAGEVAELCTQSVRAVSGELRAAYLAVQRVPQQSLPSAVRAWRYSQLGEMAQALGEQAAAAHWFSECLQLTADDMYTRAAYADLLLGQGQPQQTLQLLAGYESMEPMLLRIAIAQRQLRNGGLPASRELLENAFALEEQRGEAVHRREEARFLLDVLDQPAAALSAARANWEVQREPQDLLILLRAAQAARRPDAAADAVRFAQAQHLQDARLSPYLQGAAR